MYRTDCDIAHPVLPNRLSKVNSSCGLALQIFIFMWGAEGGERCHILMSGWRAIMTPPEGHPGQHAYTFLIRILSTSLSSVSIFSARCYSSVSISMGGTQQTFPHKHPVHTAYQGLTSFCCIRVENLSPAMGRGIDSKYYGTKSGSE
jgi:hypothetical protein